MYSPKKLFKSDDYIILLPFKLNHRNQVLVRNLCVGKGYIAFSATEVNVFFC